MPLIEQVVVPEPALVVVLEPALALVAVLGPALVLVAVLAPVLVLVAAQELALAPVVALELALVLDVYKRQPHKGSRRYSIWRVSVSYNLDVLTKHRVVCVARGQGNEIRV